jgi:alanine racemase
VDLGAVRHNVRVILDRLPPGAGLLAVVKANGYGHGAQPVARAVLDAGAWGLAVSTPQEAAELTGLVPPERLLAMGGLAPQDARGAVQAACSLTCHSQELAGALEAAAAASGREATLHLKVDTGMSRLGCRPEEAAALARRVAGSSHMRLGGVYTHLAAAGSDDGYTRHQFGLFKSTLEGLGLDPGLRHCCNSAAALNCPDMALDAVRCGIAIYGCGDPSLRPTLALRAVVTQVKEVPTGATVGYERTWTAGRSSRVATIAIGYEDGVLRSRSNRGDVVIAGRRAPLIGRVSMDQITADVTEVPDARAGQWATLIGDGISAAEVAAWSETIPYEVFTSIGSRVQRTYRE